MKPLNQTFFDRDACTVAKDLLGKIIRRKYKGQWLAARIIETEAYYMEDKSSHASLGFTEKRKALFMPPGTIYMYYARGKDSLNVSCHGEGNAVLIKSAFPYEDEYTGKHAIAIMQQLNPAADGSLRPPNKLCCGQTLLCHALALKVRDWDQQQFDVNEFYFDNAKIQPQGIIQTTRLGIPTGRDEHLHYRYIDYEFARYCTSNPLGKKQHRQGEHYVLLPGYQINGFN